MAKSLSEIAAEIVTAQASHTSMTPDEIGSAIKRTFQTLCVLRQMEESGEAVGSVLPGAAPEVSGELEELRANPKKSIRKNKITCLECGKEFRQLTNGHLKEHGLSTREYRVKYGFAVRQPLSAQSLTARRKKNAKDRNLGEKLKMARRQKKSAS